MMNDENKQLGYLEGYLDAKFLPKMKNGEKFEYRDQHIVKSRTTPNRLKWPNDSVRNFVYDTGNHEGYDQNDKYQDPTYLGFDIMFLTEESSLFNFSDDNSFNRASMQSFFQKYSEIKEINDRWSVHAAFMHELKQYFALSISDPNVVFNKQHYVETIIGLDKLTSKIVDYEKDFIEIQMTEDVSLRMQYMADLYNNLCYDYRTKREMIPENLLRFNMYVRIKDIRPFKIQNSKYPETSNKPEIFIDANNGEHDGATSNGASFTIYKLFDCNFDFVESQTHEGTMSMAGFKQYDQSNMNNMKFKIRYKSISKFFQSYLINEREIVTLNSFDISDMYHDYNNSTLSSNDMNYYNEVESNEKVNTEDKPEPLRDSVYSEEEIEEKNTRKDEEKKKLIDNNYIGDETKNDKDNRENFSKDKKFNRKIISNLTDESGSLLDIKNKSQFKDNLLNKAKGMGKNFIDKKIADAEKLVNSSIRSITQGINSKLSEVRGSLIRNLKNSIEQKLPWDKLGNVYSTNFRQMSIQNFGKNLISQGINSILDESDLMELTKISFNFKKISFSKDAMPSESLKSAFPKIGNREKGADIQPHSYLGEESDIIDYENEKVSNIRTNLPNDYLDK